MGGKIGFTQKIAHLNWLFLSDKLGAESTRVLNTKQLKLSWLSTSKNMQTTSETPQNGQNTS